MFFIMTGYLIGGYYVNITTRIYICITSDIYITGNNIQIIARIQRQTSTRVYRCPLQVRRGIFHYVFFTNQIAPRLFICLAVIIIIINGRQYIGVPANPDICVATGVYRRASKGRVTSHIHVHIAACADFGTYVFDTFTDVCGFLAGYPITRRLMLICILIILHRFCV